MSKQKPSDRFTQFTSTTPTSSSPSFKSSGSSSRSTGQNAGTAQQPSRPSQFPPGPPNETPAERVARLRALNRDAKARAAMSPIDRYIAMGRTTADYAHRYFTFFLLGCTGIAMVGASYSIVSLISHNRRQKRAWIDRELDRLQDAQQAFLRGEANAEQLHLLEQERAGMQIEKNYKEEKERRKQQSFFGQVKGLFVAKTSEGDKGRDSEEYTSRQRIPIDGGSPSSRSPPESTFRRVGDTEVELRPAAVTESAIAGVGLDSKGRPVPMNKVERVVRKVEEERRTGEREVIAKTGITGGPLDVLAGNAADATVSSGRSIWSWLGGR